MRKYCFGILLIPLISIIATSPLLLQQLQPIDARPIDDSTASIFRISELLLLEIVFTLSGGTIIQARYYSGSPMITVQALVTKLI